MADHDRNYRHRSRPPRRGRPDFRVHQTTSSNPSFVMKDLEERLATLSVDATHESEIVRLRNVRPVTSYSWIDAPVPTILVPGSPLIWEDKRAVKEVPRDSRTQMIHHDAFKMGEESPMLPLFAAIDALHENFAYKDIDLITDRKGLRKLLRYVDEAQNSDDFRIDVDLVGKTCLFTRREEMDMYSGNMGYGHEYLSAATRAPRGCEKMLLHHRVITYKFGSINILLGFSADACVESKNDDSDDVLAAFSSLEIGGKTEERKEAKPGKLSAPADVVVKLGPSRTLVPRSDLIEVKTRAIYRELDWRETYPQLYLSQTAWLYMAKHTRGVFEPVEKISLTGEEMKRHAETMQESLVKLKNLLKTILKLVREQGEGVPLSLVRRGDSLALYRRKEGTGKILDEVYKARFR